MQRASEFNEIDEWLAIQRDFYKSGLDPTGTPFLYSVHGLLSLNDPRTSYWLFQYVSSIAFVIGIGLLGLAFGLDPWQWLMAAGMLLLLSLPVMCDISVANVNRLQIFQIGLMGWLLVSTLKDRRLFWCGLIFGLATLYKPTVMFAGALLCLVMLIDRRFNQLGFFVFGAAIALVVVIIGTAIHLDLSWFDWKNYVSKLWNRPLPDSIQWANLASTSLVPQSMWRFATLSFTVVLSGLFCIRAWHTRNRSGHANPESPIGIRELTAVMSGLLVPLVAGPLAWGHYFTLAIPIGILLVVAGLRGDGCPNGERNWALLSFGAAGLFLVQMVPVAHIPNSPDSVMIDALCVQFGVLLLFCGAWFALAIPAQRLAEPISD